jgi:hypothetical protein
MPDGLNLSSWVMFLPQRRTLMTIDPSERQPKGDHNRRLSLGLDPDQFAAEAGITTEELREYERTSPDHRFDPAVAERVGRTLDRLEALLPNSQTGRNEPVPGARVEDVGTRPSEPILDFLEDEPVEPRYEAGKGEAAR